MLKVFVSQPMAGLTDYEIQATRDKIRDEMHNSFNDVVIMDSFFDDTEDFSPLECLARSLDIMARADLVVFAKGWENARGCRIEHECAISYNIPFHYAK